MATNTSSNSKSLVGRVQNKKFAYFWLLIGGSIGNIVLVLFSPQVWQIFLPPAVLSVLIAILMANRLQRPKGLLVLDLLLTAILAGVVLGRSPELAILLPDALIIFGCLLGVMNW